MNFRIKKYDKGYVVQIQKRFLFFKYWTHFIPVAGMENKAWFHCSYYFAEMGLIYEIRKNLSNNRIK